MNEQAMALLVQAGATQEERDRIEGWGKDLEYQKVLRRLYGPVLSETIQGIQELTTNFSPNLMPSLKQKILFFRSIFTEKNSITAPMGICSGYRPRY